MDLDKILLLILIALWYIFKGAKKKDKKSTSERIQEFEEKSSPQNKPPSRGRSSNLEDILADLIGEEKMKTIVTPEPPVQKYEPPKPQKQKPRVTQSPSIESQETLNPIYENLEERQAPRMDSKKRSQLIKEYESNLGEDEDTETEFDLREAIINQTILERPYIDY